MSVPPPLPLRSEGPPLPPKDSLSYSLSDSLSKVCVVRQQEACGLPALNEAGDVFGTETDLKAKLEKIAPEDTPSYEFFSELVTDYSNQIIRENRLDELEKHLVGGIPGPLRLLVYLKTLQVRFQADSTTYDALLAKARSSRGEKDVFIESLSAEPELKETLRVFNFYVNEAGSRSRPVSDGSYEAKDDQLPPNSFVIHVSQLASELPGVSREELLALLLKLNRLFAALVKDEFLYKANRCLEDLVPAVFMHATTQGINMTDFFKRVLFTFFGDQAERQLLHRVLDFLVVEGFDFLVRFLVAVFKKREQHILGLSGDEFAAYLSSVDLFLALVAKEILPEALQALPNVIKYENEYHLLQANLLNGNHNELTNLKEVNDDLVIKIHELKQQLHSLKSTHTEILDQSGTFSSQLDDAQLAKKDLTAKRDDLQAVYEHLTMKENLQNTIKANKDFSARNAELETSIAEMKKHIEEKQAKLAKYAA